MGAVQMKAGIPGKTLGEIAIFDEYTFVDVPNEFVRDILHGMKHAKIKGKRVHIELQKKKKPTEKRKRNKIYKIKGAFQLLFILSPVPDYQINPYQKILGC